VGADPKSSDNPMHAPSWGRNLALAYACIRCGARTRRGTPCKGPAVTGSARCRMHGGASPGAPSGQGNGMWKHGLRSAEAIKRRRAMTTTMRMIRQALA
jgi:hypothetical protein